MEKNRQGDVEYNMVKMVNNVINIQGGKFTHPTYFICYLL